MRHGWLTNAELRLHEASRQALAYAVQKGAIVRPNRCERCGRWAHPDGHHQDYSRPLEVEWLCKRCHAKAHRGQRGPRLPASKRRTVSMHFKAPRVELERYRMAAAVLYEGEGSLAMFLRCAARELADAVLNQPKPGASNA